MLKRVVIFLPKYRNFKIRNQRRVWLEKTDLSQMSFISAAIVSEEKESHPHSPGQMSHLMKPLPTVLILSLVLGLNCVCPSYAHNGKIALAYPIP